MENEDAGDFMYSQARHAFLSRQAAARVVGQATASSCGRRRKLIQFGDRRRPNPLCSTLLHVRLPRTGGYHPKNPA